MEIHDIRSTLFGSAGLAGLAGVVLVIVVLALRWVRRRVRRYVRWAIYAIGGGLPALWAWVQHQNWHDWLAWVRQYV